MEAKYFSSVAEGKQPKLQSGETDNHCLPNQIITLGQ